MLDVVILGQLATVVLGAGAPGASAAVTWARAAVPAVVPAQDSVERARAVHLLNRIAYGPRPGDVELVLRTGVDRFLELQLRPEDIPDSAAAAYLARLDVLRMSARELGRVYLEQQRARRARQRDSVMAPRRAPTPPTGMRRYLGEFQQAVVARAVLSERQLYEVMVDFWTNHFNVFLGKGIDRFLLPSYIEGIIRPRALGKFEDLLIATARSPAMLFYLDNAQSVAPGAEPPQLRRLRERRRMSPMRMERRARADSMLARLERRMPRGLNENYARELLELHTLGVDGGYSQDDIIDVARILTGWGIDRRDGGVEFAFREWAHDRDAKVVLGRTFRAGRGMDEGVELLRFLARHPSTMRFVSAKLCERFVSDRPPDGCIDAGAHAWARTGGDIREVVRAILTSPEFWAPEHRGAKVKTPLEFVASAVRAVGGAPDTTLALAQVVGRLGQPLYLEPAPTGYPEHEEDWVNAGALLQRFNVALAIAAGRAPGVALPAASPIAITTDYDRLVDQVNRVILQHGASAHTVTVMRLQAAEITSASLARTLLIGLALGSAEFQRQ